MKTAPYLLHALSPLHAGTGQAVSVIDLPIARMRSTGIPIVPGSSIKGVLRDARQRSEDEPSKPNTLPNEELFAVFGPDTTRASDHVGALVASDARLLALPVRSFRGTFAWVSSPILLELALRDMVGVANTPPPLGALPTRKALVGATEGAGASKNVHGRDKLKRIYLEDIDLEVAPDAQVAVWAKRLAPLVAPEGNALLFASRFVVVDDETMTFLWETATQIDTRVRLDEKTRTVAKGALWVEESLPPETILIGLLAADRSRREKTPLNAEQVLEKALPKDGEAVLQFGGKATVGRGRCRIKRISFPKESKS